MANQNFCLESLFHYVAVHNELELKKIVNTFGSTTHVVLQKLNELKDMGLPLTIDCNGVKLNKFFSPLDVKSLKSQSQKKIHYLFSTDSTNTLAKMSNEDAVFITEHQTQGRGQHGKSWLTPLGQSVALSLSYSFNFPLTHLSGLNIAIGVAVIKIIKQFSNLQVSLKWPNDIIGEFGKIAGILIEAQGSGNKCKACIGIGINWNVSQNLLDSINQPCMNVEIESVNRSQFLAYLINELDKVINEFKSNKLKNLISLWNEFDLLENQTIHITEPMDSYDATYLNVDASGMLKVLVGKEERLISSASIKIL